MWLDVSVCQIYCPSHSSQHVHLAVFGFLIFDFFDSSGFFSDHDVPKYQLSPITDGNPKQRTCFPLWESKFQTLHRLLNLALLTLLRVSPGEPQTSAEINLPLVELMNRTQPDGFWSDCFCYFFSFLWGSGGEVSCRLGNGAEAEPLAV